MAAKKRDLEKKFFIFFYFHIIDGLYFEFHDSSLIPSINETFHWILSHCVQSLLKMFMLCVNNVLKEGNKYVMAK